MELRHLRYFVQAAEEGNLSRAADRLNISQPPLTRQIRQLEDELGAILFTRSSKGVELTDAGRVFLDDARRVLDLAEQASGRARRAGEGSMGRVEIAVFGTGIFGVIPRLLRSFRNEYPDVEIVLHSLDKRQQLGAIEQGTIDLAFNRLMRPHPGIVSEVLLTEPLYVAVPSGHPLAARTAVDLIELEDQPMVLFPTGLRPSFIDQVREMCQEVGFSPEVVAEVADVVHGIALVAIGGGISLVPHSATNVHVPGVVYRPLHNAPRPEVDLCCIYREGDPAPVLANLLDSMRASVPGLLAERRFTR